METPAVERPRHSVGALILLVVDLILVTCACVELGFVVPVFGEMFADFGAKLPGPTQVVLNLAIPLTAFHHAGLAILICALNLGAILGYTHLWRSGHRRGLFGFLWTTLLIAVVACGVITVTMFLPMVTLGTTVGEPIPESPQASDATSEPAPDAASSSSQR